MSLRWGSARALVALFVSINSITSFVRAANQTDTLSPVHVGSSSDYQISVRRFDFGAAALPTLQSFAAAQYDGKWVMLAGRTNGIHGFGQTGQQNFPPAYQNKEVWVIDPVTKQSWRRSLESDTSLSALQLAELSSTNTQFTQLGNRLYVTGGYGYGPLPAGFQTYNSLTAIDLPALAQWTMGGAGSASAAIRTVRDEAFRVTGGAMYPMNGRLHLIFGQNFIGGYPNGTGIYTKQVRSFELSDDGTNLSFTNLMSSTPDESFRRRDLNVFPTMHRNGDGTISRGIEALSGVFTASNGAWTVPVYMNASEQLSMADPSNPATFKQAMNNYHSARLGLFSERSGAMHEVLFGGITLSYYDDATGRFVEDDNMPFTNQITQVNIDSAGHHTQDLLGEFPVLLDQAGNRMRFGAGAEFFPADGINLYDNGVIKLDQLTGPTVLGYVFGGIFSNAPHTQGVTGAVSGASNEIFEVMYTPVPEPTGPSCVLAAVILCLAGRRHLHRATIVSPRSLRRSS
jgi:hypothetical protein